MEAQMADDPCKKCIEEAQPVTPEPIPVTIDAWLSPDAWPHVQGFAAALQADNGRGLVREALTLMKWAIGERRQGRSIYSGDPDTGKLSRLSLPSLDRIGVE
jgi:hypothetical protein